MDVDESVDVPVSAAAASAGAQAAAAETALPEQEPPVAPTRVADAKVADVTAVDSVLSLRPARVVMTLPSVNSDGPQQGQSATRSVNATETARTGRLDPRREAGYPAAVGGPTRAPATGLFPAPVSPAPVDSPAVEPPVSGPSPPHSLARGSRPAGRLPSTRRPSQRAVPRVAAPAVAALARSQNGLPVLPVMPAAAAPTESPRAPEAMLAEALRRATDAGAMAEFMAAVATAAAAVGISWPGVGGDGGGAAMEPAAFEGWLRAGSDNSEANSLVRLLAGSAAMGASRPPQGSVVSRSVLQGPADGSSDPLQAGAASAPPSLERGRLRHRGAGVVPRAVSVFNPVPPPSTVGAIHPVPGGTLPPTRNPGRKPVDASCAPGGCVSARTYRMWTAGETKCLVDAVALDGQRWVQMARRGLPLLAGRSAADLKDRWRNLTRLATTGSSARGERGREVSASLLRKVGTLLAKHANSKLNSEAVAKRTGKRIRRRALPLPGPAAHRSASADRDVGWAAIQAATTAVAAVEAAESGCLATLATPPAREQDVTQPPHEKDGKDSEK